MPVVPINYFAILVCGVVSMILGFVWYGPLFGRQYMAMQGMTPEQAAEHMKDPAFRRKMMLNYIFTFAFALVMAFVLDHAVIFANAYMHWAGIGAGIAVGALNWLGFVAPATSNLVFFDKKNWSWWFLVNGYYLVQLALMGAILSAWM